MHAKIHDTLSFARKLTPVKLSNFAKLYTSYHLSRWRGAPNQKGLPSTVSIEPTTACNLRCPECPSGLRSFTRKTGNLKEDFFRKTIDELHRELMYLIFYFQGEPYINPNFLDMVKYAADRNIYTITSTNGHFLNDENARKTIASGLDRMIISLDGTTQEVYEQYRKEGNIDTVLAGARNMVRLKKELGSRKPYLIFQFLVVGPNEHQIPDLYRIAKEVGVDEVKLKTAQIYDFAQGHPLIPKNEKYARYKKLADGSYAIKNELLNQCWKLWHSCVITWNGKVVPCCFDKDASHLMGDLNNHTMREIWKDDAYASFRNQIFRGRSEIDICNNCTEGCKVWA